MRSGAPPKSWRSGLNHNTVRALAVGFAVVAIGVAVSLNLGESEGSVSPEEKTRSELSRLKAHIGAMVAEHQTVPASFQEISPAREPIDGWKSPFQYTPGTEGPKKSSYILRSLGKDKQLETADDWTLKVVFTDDGYGKLGNEQVSLIEPQ
jgi:hypothetical protein